VRNTLVFGLTLEDFPAWSGNHGVPDLTYLPVPE